MQKNKAIQVFEHEKLLIGQQNFTHSQWESLGWWYNQKHNDRFLSLLPNGVKFNEHVGIIQVGNKTIEILPKVDQQDTDKNKWQQVLINMLRECHWMQQHANQKAPLRIKHNSILDAYLELFLNHCDIILHKGLVKKYKEEQSNKLALKGKLLFSQQIQHNSIHQERFFTRHTIYDKNNIFNQILLKSIHLIPKISRTIRLKDRVSRLLLDFPELNDIQVTKETFSKLIFNRKNYHYKEAIDIAAMLLLNYRPDIRGGNNHVLAILFDMNELWEEYVYRQLRKNLKQGWYIKAQNQKRFWEEDSGYRYKIIKPDIAIINDKDCVIIDTKWKLPENNIPSDRDLKQMFVYNEYWTGKTALLLYPDKKYLKSPFFSSGSYKEKPSTIGTHKCSVLKMSVLNEANNGLDSQFGNRIIKVLNDKILN